MTDPVAADPAPSFRRFSADTVLAALAVFLAAVLGLCAGLVPRGLPVWINLATLTALAALVRWRAMPLPSPGGRAGAAVAAGFLGLAAASLPWTPAGRAPATLGELAYIAAAALIAGAAVRALVPATAERLGLAVAAGMTVGIVLFGVETNADFPLYHLFHGGKADPRTEAFNVPKRAAAALAVLVWPVALMLYHRWGARAAAAVLVLMAAVSLGQSSRSALAGLAAGGLVLLAVRRWPAAAVREGLMAVTVAAFAGAVPAALVAERVAHLSDAGWLFQSARHRVEIWDRAATKILESPWLGLGLDSSRAVPAGGVTSKFEPMDNTLLPLHPHNAFLQVWFELGAAGAVLATALLLLVLRAVGRLAAGDQPLALALYAAGLTLSSMAYGLWQAWWMAALMAAALLTALAVRSPWRRPS
ncbi:O-antigen ligase [Azospirillum fermentarium]|uniref:O-antigen ligase family protein n=1 Tax=Azospirillum fermentarium TaxID=1233114 RepID=UPI002227B34E|nr:O-antigen ligase family protein [Azospirillum fermentarium]MCW2245766.1 O-antigen ligase [Azospirillum fermentarium]